LPWGWDVALAAVSSVLLAALGYDHPHLAWVAFVPLLIGIRPAGPGRAALLSLLCGWGLEIGTSTWVLGIPVSLPAYLLLTAFCALRWGVLGALAALPWGAWRLVVLPGACVVLEYVRLHQGPFSITWALVGYSQASFLPAARLAAWAGIYGVSFVVVAVNVAVAELVLLAFRAAGGPAPSLRTLTPPLAVLGLSAALVASQVTPTKATAPASDHELRVVAVQGGIYRRASDDEADRVRVVERYRRMSREATTGAADLVVWPEGSFPAAIPADAGALRAVFAIAKELGAPLLLAASGADKTNRGARPGRVAANSAFLVDPGGRIRGRYDKVRLLPFNEYVPLRGIVSWPDWIVSDFLDAIPGSEWTHFDLDRYRFAVLICWENFFPHDFRDATEGADFVVSLTNESFTGSRAAHRQLLDMNRFRAIESGVWIVRAATTAESAVISPSGELVARVLGPEADGADALGTLSVAFPPVAVPTLYRRFGDWLVLLQVFLLPAIAVGRWRRLRRQA
jgi:apolipoprotein N-acyltransferase